MAKTCINGCNASVFAKKRCMTCWKAEFGKPIQRKTPIQTKRTEPIKVGSVQLKRKVKIKQISDKERKRLDKYYDIRDKWLPDHPYCEAKLEYCTDVATEVHHMEGRLGELLFDITKWKSVCSNCHKTITAHTRQAIKDGLALARNGVYVNKYSN